MSTMDLDTDSRIRRILEEHARLGRDVNTIADGDSLYDSGLSSHASVSVMLAIEDTFDIEFPDNMLNRRVFESIASIREAVDELLT